MKFKRAKIFILLFVFCAISYFTNDFQLINIEKTAIIVALAIDKSEDELEVTAQIAVPQASNQNVSNSDAILTAKDKTLYGALEKISLETGWYPKLTFCNLILLGSEVVKGDFMPIVDYILTSNRFQNSSVIASTENSAKEALKCTTPLDYISSFALQKTLLRNLNRSSSVSIADVRKFTALARSRSQYCYMPVIKSIQTEDKPQGDSAQGASKFQENLTNQTQNIYPLVSGDGSGSSGSGSSGGSSKSGGEDQSVVFDASQTLFFSKGKVACTLSTKQTHAYNLITKKVRESFIPITLQRGEKQVNALISVVSNKHSVKIKAENGEVQVQIDLVLVCEKEETFLNEDVDQLAKPSKVSKEGLEELEKLMRENIESLFELSKSCDCDFLELQEILYRTLPSQYAELKDNLLSRANFEVNVICKNYR